MLVKVQFPSGRFDEMAEHLANNPRLQKKFGFRIISTPATVDELKKEVSEKKEIVNDATTITLSDKNPLVSVDVDSEQIEKKLNKGGRPKKVETKK